MLSKRTVGFGIAVRGEAFGLSEHYIRWYQSPVKVPAIPQTLNALIEEFLKNLKSRDPRLKLNSSELIGSITSVIENSSNDIALSMAQNQSSINSFESVARSLSIAWDQIRRIEDRIYVTTKFILLLSTLSMIFYEVVRNERLGTLSPLDCETLDIYSLAQHLFSLIYDKSSNRYRYAELDTNFINVLSSVPRHPQFDVAVRSICREIRRNYVLIRRFGWDLLSMLYQRLLSETYRHAFATFYTKLPAARLLATLAIENLNDRVIDPASGTGSLLLATVERRRMLLSDPVLRELYAKAFKNGTPLLDLVDEIILRNTVGLDALKPAIFIAALNLRTATRGLPTVDSLNLYDVPVGTNRAGSLDLLIPENAQVLLSSPLRAPANESFDVVIMNPPFTRSDRIPLLIGSNMRDRLMQARLRFGGIDVKNLFVAGMAKPFMVLADKLVKKGGRIAVVLPNSILSRPSWRDVREGLLQSYNIEYIVVSWAPGTPNFSSDTQFREILLVARKISGGNEGERPLRIVNLYKKVDDLSFEDIELISKTAVKAVREPLTVTREGEAIASIVPIDVEEGIRRRLKGAGVEGSKIEVLIKERLRWLSNNLYRFIAFGNGELLKMHLDIVTKCSVKFGDLFEVGSVVDHTTGLTEPVDRASSVRLYREMPALWGSGENLGVKIPWLKAAPYKIGVEDETRVKVKYWGSEKSPYTARVFILRRGGLSTQYALLVYVNEDSISNVWWPLKPKIDNSSLLRYLIYLNSVFGFIHFLGERLETGGLYVEYKKNHLETMPIPDLRNVKIDEEKALAVLQKPMPRFDEYIEFMAKQNQGRSWVEIAQGVVSGAEHQIYANRARLDLLAYDMLLQTCPEVYVPSNLYEVLSKDVNTLRQIMESENLDEDSIEDIVEIVERRAKHIPLNKWFKPKAGK